MFLSGSPAMLASEVIMQQILLLRMPALDGEVSGELIPFSDLKPPLNKYIFELWQRGWDQYPQNK